VSGRHGAWRRVASRCWSSDGNRGDDITNRNTEAATTTCSTNKRLDGIAGSPELAIPKLMPILKPGFQPTGTNKDGVFVGSTFLMLSPQTLPELDCAPVLNKTLFTRKIGTSKHGSDAAIRLYKAKNELKQVILQELATEDKTNFQGSWSAGQVKKMYIMRRHGVPNQLLQHLITVADRWLEEKNALELCVDSSGHSSLSVFTTEGASWRTLWPTEWDDDVALYLAVMKRMASHLATITPFCEGTSVLPADLAWKVAISRHNKLPLTLFPNDPEILPVIEWVTPRTNEATTNNNATTTSKAPRKIGKILIRIQGATKPIIPGEGQEYLKQSHDASFIFEANFDAATTLSTTSIQS
jgi:hypothetical protein